MAELQAPEEEAKMHAHEKERQVASGKARMIRVLGKPVEIVKARWLRCTKKTVG